MAVSPSLAGTGGATPVSDSGPAPAGSVPASRRQRKPKTTVSTTPTAAAGQLTTRPTRMQTTPIAKPIGHRLGGGRCGLPWPCWGSTLERLPFPAHLVGFNRVYTASVNDVTDAATLYPRKVLRTFRSRPRLFTPFAWLGRD